MYHYGTHEYEEGVYVVRKVSDHVLVVTQNGVLQEVPTLEPILFANEW